MATDYTPYVIIDDVTMSKVMYVHELQHILRMVKCDKKIEL